MRGEQSLQPITPSLSVILPVYNHGTLLASAINSILEQSFRDFELIIINDGSTDNSAQTIESFTDSRIVSLEQTNQGIAAALNYGFSNARGSLLTWTSADNLYLPGAIEKLVDYLYKNPLTDLVYGNLELINEDGDPLTHSSYRLCDQNSQEPHILNLPREPDSLCYFSDNFIMACFMYRRELMQRTGIYRSDLAGLEDYDYWLRASLSSKLSHIGLAEPLYQYRLHSNSLTETLDKNSILTKQKTLLRKIQQAKTQVDELCELRLRKNAKQLDSSLIASLKSTSWANAESTITPNFPALSQGVNYRCLEKIEKGACSIPSELYEAWPGYIELQSNSKLACSTWKTFAPLKLSKALLRARDSNFRAVVANQDTEFASLLVLPPSADFELCKDRLADIIESSPATVAVFCSTTEQRSFSDQLYIRLNASSKLRIIDCSTQTQDQHDDRSRLASLLYSLSSVQSLFYPISTQISPCTIHLLASIAAYAQRKLILLPIGQEAVLNLANLDSYLNSSPHIQILAAGQCLEASPLPNRESMDQWLAKFSTLEFQKSVSGMCFALEMLEV